MDNISLLSFVSRETKVLSLSFDDNYSDSDIETADKSEITRSVCFGTNITMFLYPYDTYEYTEESVVEIVEIDEIDKIVEIDEIDKIVEIDEIELIKVKTEAINADTTKKVRGLREKIKTFVKKLFK